MRIELNGRRKVVFICGLLLIAVGAYSLITDSGSSGVVASLFTIAGMVISYMQLFLTAPSASLVGIPAGAHTQVIADGSQANPPTAVTAAAGLMSAAAFFLAAPLIAVSYIIGLQGITDIHQFRTAAVLDLLGFLIAIFAYIGFYALQAPRTPRLAAVTTVLTISSLTLNVAENFLLLVASDPGRPFPSAEITLFHYNLYLITVADILIAVTVLRAGVFPRWTAWTCLTVAGCALLLLRFPSSRTAGTIGNIAGIALCLVYVAFGSWLGRRTRRA